MHHADDDPGPFVQGKRVANVESLAVARGGQLLGGSTAAQFPGNPLAEHDLDGGPSRALGRRLVGRRFHAGVGEPFSAGIQGKAMHLGRQLRVLDAAELEAASFRPARRGVGERLVDDEVDFAACQGAADGVAGDAWLMVDVSDFHRPHVAEHFVGGAVGKNDDVVRVARALRQCVHAVDEGQHQRQQGDDEREGQGGHQRGLPPHAQVAEVVAQRNLPGSNSPTTRRTAATDGIANWGEMASIDQACTLVTPPWRRLRPL